MTAIHKPALKSTRERFQSRGEAKASARRPATTTREEEPGDCRTVRAKGGDAEGRAVWPELQTAVRDQGRPREPPGRPRARVGGGEQERYFGKALEQGDHFLSWGV